MSRIHLNIRKNILIWQFYKQFFAILVRFGLFLKDQEISNSQNVNKFIMYHFKACDLDLIKNFEKI